MLVYGALFPTEIRVLFRENARARSSPTVENGKFGVRKWKCLRLGGLVITPRRRWGGSFGNRKDVDTAGARGGLRGRRRLGIDSRASGISADYTRPLKNREAAARYGVRELQRGRPSSQRSLNQRFLLRRACPASLQIVWIMFGALRCKRCSFLNFARRMLIFSFSQVYGVLHVNFNLEFWKRRPERSKFLVSRVFENIVSQWGNIHFPNTKSGNVGHIGACEKKFFVSMEKHF